LYSEAHPEIQWSQKERKEIEEDAYYKWLNAGRPEGKGHLFWQEAEEEKFINTFFPKTPPTEMEVIELDYHAPRAPSKKHDSGYKGTSYLDAGYIYAPYVPLMSTPVVLDNIFIDLSTVRSTGSRYKEYERLRNSEELTDILSREIAEEIDREIIQDLRNCYDNLY